MDTAPEPTAAPLVPQEPPEPSPLEMFDLNGRGLNVPLAEVLAMADKDCRYCTGGWQWTVLGERRTRRVCGCAIRLMRRKLAGETPSTTFVKVTKDPSLERERVTKKIANLEAIVGKLEDEVAEKIAGHDRGIAEAEGNARIVQAGLAFAIDAASIAKGRLGEMEVQLEELKAAIARKKSDVDALGDLVTDALREKAVADAAVTEAKEASQRILDQAKPLRHRIERLQGKIALTKQQHADVLGS